MVLIILAETILLHMIQSSKTIHDYPKLIPKLNGSNMLLYVFTYGHYYVYVADTYVPHDDSFGQESPLLLLCGILVRHLNVWTKT